MDAERRLTRLEEDLCFVETELRSLGEVVAAQQSQLDALSRELGLLQARFREVLALVEDGRAPVNVIPPHHVARLW